LQTAEVQTLIDLGYLSIFSDNAALATTAVGTTKHSMEHLRDYISYHGVDIYPGFGGLIGRGPADQVQQLLELHAELLRAPNVSVEAAEAASAVVRPCRRANSAMPDFERREQYLPAGLLGLIELDDPILDVDWLLRSLGSLSEIHRVRLYVVGDVDADQVVSGVEALWGDWHSSGSLGTTSKPSSTDEIVPSQPAQAQVKPVWCGSREPEPWLSICDSVGPSTLAPASEWLVGDSAAAMVGMLYEGVPSLAERAMDDRTSWRWHAYWTRGVGTCFIMAQVRVKASSLSAELRAELSRLDDLSSERVPLEQVANAWRRAQCERLKRLDSASALANSLARGVQNPWDVQADLGPEQVRKMVAALHRVLIRVVAGGGNSRLEPEFRRLIESWPLPGAQSVTPPSSP
jgi:hypothetical protein